MLRELDGIEERRVRCVTTYGRVDGALKTHSGVSTLHYLNVAASASDFITLEPPIDSEPDLDLDSGALAVATSSILFIQELTEYQPIIRDPEAAASFQRTPVSVNLGTYLLRGFMHCAPGVQAVQRISSDRHAFIAMSSVSVVGPEQFAADFVAVRRDRILLAQAIRDDVLTGIEFDDATGVRVG